jgi:drug/metabolite transporter (DMT)-like permease
MHAYGFRVHAVRALALGDYRSGVLYILGAAVSFGLLGTLSGLAYRGGMGPATFTALRATVGVVALLAFACSSQDARVDLRSLSRRERVMLGTAIVANASLNLVLFAAYGAMAVALVLAIYFTYPLLVAVASVALGRERFTRVRVAGLALAVAGVALVVGGQIGPDARPSFVGLALAGAAAVCQATYLVVSRSGYTRVPSRQATTLILTGGAILAGIVALVTDMPAGRLLAWAASPGAWAGILIAGTLGAALAKVWLLRGVRRIGGTRTAVLMLGEPLVGAAAAALVLGQQLTAPALVGGVAIVVAAALVQAPTTRGVRVGSPVSAPPTRAVFAP